MTASENHTCDHPGCAHHHHTHSEAGQQKHIYVYSPSGAVQDKAAFRRGVKRLQQADIHVTVDEAALLRSTRFAGDHATRLAAISRAAQSGANIALISRGGYGLNHLLPHLDYAAIAHSIEHGTQWMGFSDFTAFQLAVLAKTGCHTWAGASLGMDFGSIEAPDEITQACFEDVLYGVAEGTGWRLGQDNARYDGLACSNAVVWGGNLAVLVSLIGTPYMPKIKNGILFLEDIGEAPYQIERMLIQLEQAGILQQQKAVLLGQFTDSKPSTHDRGFNLRSVTEELRARLDVPILTRLPFGHVRTKVCLPVGVKANLEVNGKEAMLVWGHL